jgi:predicted RNA-binding protein with PIN domain
MSLIIDGYNLLHASGVMPSGRGPHTFQRAREALLRVLAASLTEEERARTIIVFDAREAPYNLPRTVDHEEMTVRFAPRDMDADTLIEELIRADSSPTRLTVVSSDHRIQNAAKRRRATPVDSDIWWAELMRRREVDRGAAPAPAKPDGPLPESEVARWMKEFQVDPSGEKAGDDTGKQPGNPFPPGYGEDIEHDDEKSAS